MIQEKTKASQSLQKGYHDKRRKELEFQERDHVFFRVTPNLSHVIQVDDIQVRENLAVKASPVQIEDREVKQLRANDIALVKVVWGGPAGGSITWELENQMRKSYLTLFPLGASSRLQVGTGEALPIVMVKFWCALVLWLGSGAR
ncbi:hypothetical protein KIW84_046201 [Lathyrus oleraceus]|uniref:Retrotransposon gag protein n=1 Tax=Pisum sativum TaxID=3888 RepID=A0A9D5AYB9_PEA|nr:hypothetical protein KIW84_046201 [Pisum sativum]